MVQIIAVDSEMGPVVTEVKGIRGGREWLQRTAQECLSYRPDGSIGLRLEDWARQVPAELRKRGIMLVTV